MNTDPSNPHITEAHTQDPRQVMATRELFWQNVMREILTSLSMMCALRPAPALGGGVAGAPAEAVDGEQTPAMSPGKEAKGSDEGSTGAIQPLTESDARFDPQLFDGRLAVMTRRGERIPIADVFPVFACGIDTPRERVLSLALECTIFQIRTPVGEVYTLPLHELASFQSLTPELMSRLARMARRQQERETGEKGVQQPFGFAAFTSLSRETPPPMTQDSAHEAEESHRGQAGEGGQS
jgi:hypothetical protein